MEHTLMDYQKIYQALQSSLSSIQIEEDENNHNIYLSLQEAARNLNQAFQYELFERNNKYD